MTLLVICDRCRAGRCDDCELRVRYDSPSLDWDENDETSAPCACREEDHPQVSTLVAAESMLGLTFDRLRATNVARCLRWHPTFEDDDDPWSGADWGLAMCGEAGEAANIVKKIRRVEVGVAPGPDDPPLPDLLAMLADELADVVTYADLLAAKYGLDLGVAVASKFDRVSERQGFPERLGS